MADTGDGFSTRREITVKITKLNEPHFAQQRGLWLMVVKEPDRWIAINAWYEVEVRDHYVLLAILRSAGALNFTVQTNMLSRRLDGECLEQRRRVPT